MVLFLNDYVCVDCCYCKVVGEYWSSLAFFWRVWILLCLVISDMVVRKDVVKLLGWLGNFNGYEVNEV